MNEIVENTENLKIGYGRLIEEFSLRVCRPLTLSFLSERSQFATSETLNGRSDFYPKNRFARLSADDWREHLLFALKHEGANLEVLKAFFAKITADEMASVVKSHPTGSYYRRIWFFYEKLTGSQLPIRDCETGNYVEAIDSTLQFSLPAESAIRERRYRVSNNLIGDTMFCPFVRQTPTLRKLSAAGLKARSDAVLADYSPELIYRAVQYLYIKETKSSFAIERETPDQKRTNAFVSLLHEMPEGPLSEAILADIQNHIVDPRYAQHAWRTSQVYVGETISPTKEKIHFIAVRPDDVDAFMSSWLDMTNRLLKCEAVDAIVVAAVVAFAFAFIHPFDDGNGRLHRYLMHYVLARTGFSPRDVIFPISAVLLKKAHEYDRLLESFSRRLMESISYRMDANGEVTVRGESADFYRFIDFTPIVEGFQRLVQETIETEWKAELDYLKWYDDVRARMREVVDMPEQKANQFIMFVKQNAGHLAERKRERFSELTDEEIARLEEIIQI